MAKMGRILESAYICIMDDEIGETVIVKEDTNITDKML
ncbi:MAG: hypothetical protein ACI9LE_000480 [Paraglaciecola sp.]|jgi:hypothetical protein